VLPQIVAIGRYLVEFARWPLRSGTPDPPRWTRHLRKSAWTYRSLESFL